MPRFNAISRNVNTINLKIFSTHGVIYKFQGNLNKHFEERVKAIRNFFKKLSLKEILKDKGSKQLFLPLC